MNVTLDPDPRSRIADDVQGNVLAGFLKDHQTFAFFTISDRATARAWIGQLAVAHISTQGDVRAFNDLFKTIGSRSMDATECLSATWLNVAFTNQGLAALGVPAEVLASLESSFRESMVDQVATSLGDVGDSGPANWREMYRDESRIHVLFIVASDSKSALAERLASLTNLATQNGMAFLGKEDGEARSDRPGHEHFGFRDGVSQPRPQVDAADDPCTDGTTPWNFVIQPTAPPAAAQIQTPVTVSPTVEPGWPAPTPPSPPQPTAPAPALDLQSYGSYLVFRRLAQDVKGFEAFVAAHQPPGYDLGSKLMGRYQSGAPLIDSMGLAHADPAGASRATIVQSDLIDGVAFDFANDSTNQVPGAAHIRKSNPRGGNAVRIMRRGIAYGAPYSPDASDGTVNANDAERGLLFACYQSSIKSQYEFIQQQWVNVDTFPSPPSNGTAPGVDPIIGKPTPCVMTIPGLASSPLTLQSFVKTEGCVYLFSPSITALKAISVIAT